MKNTNVPESLTRGAEVKSDLNFVLGLVSYVYDDNECECVPGDNLWRDFPCRV